MIGLVILPGQRERPARGLNEVWQRIIRSRNALDLGQRSDFGLTRSRL